MLKVSYSLFSKSLFPLYLLMIMTVGFVLQHYLFLNWDVAYFLNAAQLSLHHGQYVQDFFTPNPPLILWLNFPPLWLSEGFHIDIAMSFQLYVMFLIAGSLGLCFSLVNHIFKPAKLNRVKQALLYVLPCIFLIIPMYDFGQREHLFVIFIAPYLFLMSDRLCVGTPYPWLKTCLIGFLAFLGFAIKPQFVITFLLVELYYIWQIKSIKAWWRSDMAVIISLGILYFLVLLIFYKPYIHIIIPYLTRNYYASLSESLYSLLSPPIVLFCFSPFLFYGLFKTSVVAKMLSVFYVALFGALLSFVMQHTSFYYHLIPALSYSFLLSFLLVAWISTENTLTDKGDKKKYWIVFMVSLALLTYPTFFLCQVYRRGVFYKEKVLMPIRDFLSLKNAHSMYVFSSKGNYHFPVSLYAHIAAPARFDCLWPIMGVLRKTMNTADEQYFVNMVTEDLEQKKPEFIFVDQWSERILQYDKHFNFIQFFSHNTRFKQEWQYYHYVATLQEPDSYKMDIYQRGVKS